MAVGKEIRTQIKSIKNTQKITSAMEMVAASKMKKVQERMNASRPYSEKITQIINHLSYASSEFKHDFMRLREVKNIGYIIVSSDRGLCGGLNNNLFREVLIDINKWQQNKVNVQIAAIGNKAGSYFKYLGVKVVSLANNIGDAPNLENLRGIINGMIDKFEHKKIDQLNIVYNNFVNTMTQKPVNIELLPLKIPEDVKENKDHWDYIYEPEAKEVLMDLLIRYIDSIVYQSVVENVACEQSARMVAMKSATDNAGEMIKDLELIYNKARQTAITQEISEIVGGAAAV